MSPAARSVPLGLGVALLIAVGVFMYLNRANIKVHMRSHEVGDMVRWNDSPKTYGKVMRFDPDHSFGSGIPGPAYEIQLEGTTDTVWVGERIAETRMARVGQ